MCFPLGDRAFGVALVLLGVAVPLVFGLIVLACARLARPLFAKVPALAFLVGSDWDPVQDRFGALPFLYGTVVTSPK